MNNPFRNFFSSGVLLGLSALCLTFLAGCSPVKKTEERKS